jgi:hypothetical protein
MKNNKKAQKNLFIVLSSTTVLLLLLTLVSFFIPKKSVEKIDISFDTKVMIEKIKQKRSNEPLVVSESDEVITETYLDEECNLIVSTNYKEIELRKFTNITGECLFLDGEISESGKFFVYDESGAGDGINKLFLYTLDYGRILYLEDLGNFSSINYIFFENDKLALLSGTVSDPDEKRITIYNIPEISRNMNTNFKFGTSEPEIFYPDNLSYEVGVKLPNTGEAHISLDYDGTYLQTFGETGILLAQLLPEDILMNSGVISPNVAKVLARSKYTEGTENNKVGNLNFELDINKTSRDAWAINITDKSNTILETYYVNSRTGKVYGEF